MNVDSQAWGCAGLWANINPPGAGNNVHLHEGVISGAVWLQCDTEKSGGLAFVDPRIRSKLYFQTMIYD